MGFGIFDLLLPRSPFFKAVMIATVSAGMAIGLMPANVDAQELPRLDQVGFYTMQDLGYEDIILQADSPYAIATLPGSPPEFYAGDRIEYDLPIGASQGEDLWYVLHLHFEIEVIPEDRDGNVTVYAHPNARTAAMVTIQPDAANESGFVWSSRGLTEGLEIGRSDTNLVEVRMSNYLPFAGIRPGMNWISFSARQNPGLGFDTLRIFDDTALEVTSLAPPDLAIEQGTAVPSQDGGIVDIPFAMSNAGDWPMKDVETFVSYDDAALRLIGEPSITIPLLEGDQVAERSFKFEVLIPGVHEVRLSAQTNGGGNVGATVTFVGGVEESVPKWRLWALLAGVVAASLLPFVPYRTLLTAARSRGASS